MSILLGQMMKLNFSMTNSPNAGKKRSVGRPVALNSVGRNVNTYLDMDSIAIAQKLGDGNVSEGIRRALKLAAEHADKAPD